MMNQGSSTIAVNTWRAEFSTWRRHCEVEINAEAASWFWVWDLKDPLAFKKKYSLFWKLLLKLLPVHLYTGFLCFRQFLCQHGSDIKGHLCSLKQGTSGVHSCVAKTSIQKYLQLVCFHEIRGKISNTSRLLTSPYSTHAEQALENGLPGYLGGFEKRWAPLFTRCLCLRPHWAACDNCSWRELNKTS